MDIYTTEINSLTNDISYSNFEEFTTFLPQSESSSLPDELKNSLSNDVSKVNSEKLSTSSLEGKSNTPSEVLNNFLTDDVNNLPSNKTSNISNSAITSRSDSLENARIIPPEEAKNKSPKEIYSTYKTENTVNNTKEEPEESSDSQDPKQTYADEKEHKGYITRIDKSGLSGGAIAGIVLSIVFAIAGTCCCCFFFILKRKKKEKKVYSQSDFTNAGLKLYE